MPVLSLSRETCCCQVFVSTQTLVSNNQGRSEKMRSYGSCILTPTGCKHWLCCVQQDQKSCADAHTWNCRRTKRGTINQRPHMKSSPWGASCWIMINSGPETGLYGIWKRAECHLGTLAWLRPFRGNRTLVGDDRSSRDTRLEYLVLAEEQYRRRLFLSKCEKVQIFTNPRNR